MLPLNGSNLEDRCAIVSNEPILRAHRLFNSLPASIRFRGAKKRYAQAEPWEFGFGNWDLCEIIVARKGFIKRGYINN